MKNILLSCGSGGEESNALIKELFYRYFANDILLLSEDAARLSVGKNIAFTTDSFTIDPIFFNGGDIGKIAICGTINDLCMMGAKPLYLSCAFMIEEGFCYEKLEKIVKSMAFELSKSEAKIVAGDTKVVPKGSLDGIFINTSGIGEIVCDDISSKNLQKNAKIIVSNEIGNHGSSILAAREELNFDMPIKSDCASLWCVIDALFKANIKPYALRDATRGGLSAVLNEWAQNSNVGIVINEDAVPVSNAVRGLCEFLGFEPYELANEGTFIACVKDEDAKKTLEILQKFPQICHEPSIIGEVVDSHKTQVILKTPWQTKRFLQMPTGELLPRIC